MLGLADIERPPEWLSGPLKEPHPIFPFLCEQFDLDVVEVAAPIRRAVILRREKAARDIEAARRRQAKYRGEPYP